eukprot:CAMPEP_0206537006 /NCGR_PEP_ID=MMETSP0325_2-20121206/7080_1 /ASSEMBLY_ACC=CAM_ASM_000347 /TAXON_ID=2866 /ORGANISM="Crypthecodinium cohnii, Strain Seligo" /LENGTH=752 /DNA_ID=CAMNT_0054034311 /DNA_START=132 /DNA_END=2387 /DNA_ORIENTATION=-
MAPLPSLTLLLGVTAASADRTLNLLNLDIFDAAHQGLRPSLRNAGQSSSGSSLISRAFREQLVEEPLMCGDTAIRRTLQLSEEDRFDVERVKSIQFDSAFQSANNYLEKQKDQESKLATMLQQLETQWYETSSSALTKKLDLPEATISQHISAAVGANWGSAKAALDSECSQSSDSAATAPDPYEASKTLFSTSLKKILEVGTYKPLSRKRVEVLCGWSIGINATKPSSICSSLCDAFGAIAQSVSEIPYTSLGNPSAGELTERIQQTTAKLDQVKDSIKDCEGIRDGIRTYESQIKSIASEHDTHGKMQREVRSRIKEIDTSLKELQKSVAGQTALLTELQGLVGKTQATENSVQGQISANKEKMDALTTRTAEVRANMEELKTELQSAQSAVRAMQAFRAGLVMTMQSFVQIYDDAIRRPLRSSGITKALQQADVNLWPSIGQSAKVWNSPLNFVMDLEDECKAVAAQTLASCQRQPLLSSNATLNSESEVTSLCEAGKTLQNSCSAEQLSESYVTGVREAIEGRQTAVKEWIQNLKMELENLSDPKGSESVAGEPEWLRRFSGILAKTQFYQDFVAQWTPQQGAPTEEMAEGDKTGIVFNMYKALGGVQDQLSSKVSYATHKLKELSDEYVASVRTDASLRDKLMTLSTQLSAEEKQRISLNAKISEFEGNAKSKESEKERFETQLATLNQKLRDLEVALRESFSKFQGLAGNNFAAAAPAGELPSTGTIPTPETEAALSLSQSSLAGR